MLEQIASDQNPTTPKRIQMSRQRPWRADNPDAVIVARPSKWGNPFAIGLWYGASGPNGEWSRSVHIYDRADAATEYRRAARLGHPNIPSDLSPLRGKDLACWCPLDQPCHADVLLDIANGGAV